MFGPRIYIRIHVSQLASAPRQSSKVHKHSHLFLLLSLQKLSEEFTDSFIQFMLSFFFLHFFFFTSLEHFMNAKSEAVPNDFSPRVIFCWGGMYLSNIHWHLKPIQIFPGVWRNMGRTALFYMGPWRILFWINSCLNTDEKCQIYVFIAFSGKDNWMGCKSWHFYASEILSIIFKKINDDARVWSSRNLTACYCKMHLQFFFSNYKCHKAQMTLWINLSMNQDLICIFFPQINGFYHFAKNNLEGHSTHQNSLFHG